MKRFQLVLAFTALAAIESTHAGGVVPATGGVPAVNLPGPYNSYDQGLNRKLMWSGNLPSNDYQRQYADPSKVPSYLADIESYKQKAKEENGVHNPMRILRGRGSKGGGGSGGSGSKGGPNKNGSGSKGRYRLVPRVKHENSEDNEDLTGPTFDGSLCATSLCDVLTPAFVGYVAADMVMPTYLPASYDWAAALKDQQWGQLTSNKDVLVSRAFGGPHGEPFNDLPRLPKDPRDLVVTKISLYGGGDRLTGIQFHYGEDSIRHASDSKGRQELTLSAGEVVVGAMFSSCEKGGHTRICSAAFTTNKGNSVAYAPAGLLSRPSVIMVVPENYAIKALHGRQGDRLDMVGVFAVKMTPSPSSTSPSTSPKN